MHEPERQRVDRKGLAQVDPGSQPDFREARSLHAHLDRSLCGLPSGAAVMLKLVRRPVAAGRKIEFTISRLIFPAREQLETGVSPEFVAATRPAHPGHEADFA